MALIMSRTILVAFVGCLIAAAAAKADIQNPPLSHYTPVTKLGRGLGNIAFAVTELPDTMKRVQRTDGTKAAWSVGLVDGAWRTVKRVGYGAYEVATFPAPVYKGTYRQPYKRGELYPHAGLKEYAPELGFQGGASYSRLD